MKRLVLFGFVLVFTLLAGYLRFGPIEPVRKVASHLPEDVTRKIRPEIIPAIANDLAFPPAVELNYPRPKWENDAAKQGKLVSIATLQANDLGRHKVNGNRLNYLATGSDFIAVADLASKHVVILAPELKIRRKWPMTAGVASLMQAPIALTARNDEIAALDQDGTLVWWDSRGKRLGSFAIDGVVSDLAIQRNGDLLVHQTKPYPYVLAQYERNGRKEMQFGALTSDDVNSAPLLHQGHLALSNKGEVALVLINPYQLYFFNADGRPRLTVRIIPEFQVFEPFAEQLGAKRWRVLRQKVVHDVQWHQGQLWVLVAPDAERAASWLEIFSSEGELLQRYYLTMNAIQITFWQDDLVLLGFDPRLKMERFRIERIQQ